MPHIFFERLERRRSTQSLFATGINGLNMGPSGTSQAYSSYSPSSFQLNSLSISSNYTYSGGLSDPTMPGPMCYAMGPPPIWEYPRIPIWESPPGPTCYFRAPIFEIPIFGPYTPSSPSWTIPNTWNSLFQNLWQTPTYQAPSWNSPGSWSAPMSNYLQTPSYQLFNWGNYPDRLSKLKKVRNNLIAFFQNKGILSDKQGQRLLSSPFNKA